MLKRLKTTKNKWMTLLLTSLLLGLSIFFTNTNLTRSEQMAKVTPTLFVHGFKGGPKSFGPMIQRFTENKWGADSMVIYVHNDGTLTTRGHITKKVNPMIQVLFENNRASIADQTNWMKKIMETLKEKYFIQQVNVVGHSMGGIAAASFLENNQSDDFPDMTKLAVIASPFNGIDKEGYAESNYGEAVTDLLPGSDALIKLKRESNHFDSHVEVLSIAGVINKEKKFKNHWDGLVHVSSVRGLKSIMATGRYKEKIVYGKEATHSGLHEHDTVDQALGQFLWNIQSSLNRTSES